MSADVVTLIMVIFISEIYLAVSTCSCSGYFINYHTNEQNKMKTGSVAQNKNYGILQRKISGQII